MIAFYKKKKEIPKKHLVQTVNRDPCSTQFWKPNLKWQVCTV